MYTKQYALIIAEIEDINRCIGESYFTFDTPQQAKDFAATEFFKKEFWIANMSAWEESNIHEDKRYNATFLETGTRYTAPRTMGLIIVPIEHNPQEKQS